MLISLDELMDKAMEYHQALVEVTAENDEELMEKFLMQAHSPRMRCVLVSVVVLPIRICTLYSV